MGIQILTQCVRFLSLWLAVVLLSSAFASQPGQGDAVPGYILVTGWYKDRIVQRSCNEAVAPILGQHGDQTSVLAMPGANLRVLEGGWTGRMTLLIKFPSERHAKGLWRSDAYQKAKTIRASVSALEIVQVDGIPGVTPRMDEAAAYLFFRGSVHDRQIFTEEYAPFSAALVRQHGGEFLLRSGRAQTELLEGSMGNLSLVVVEFPTGEALTRFWTRDRYRVLSEIRKASGKWSVVEVMPRPQRATG